MGIPTLCAVMRALHPVVVLSAVMASGCVAHPRWQGPLPTRNQHPAQLTVMHMPPAGAAVLAPGATAGRIDAAYTSLFLYGSKPGAGWTMDGEYLRTAVTLRHGIASDLEAAVELPVGYASGGFLDSFLIDYHRTFGFPDQDRDVTPRNRFVVSAQRNGNEVFGVDPGGVHLLDVPLWLTWQAVAPTDVHPGLALRGGVELPTGDQRAGYGNGQLDASVGMVGEWRVGGVAWYAHVQHTFAGSPAPARDVRFAFEDVTSLGLAAELPLIEDLHAFAQVEWEDSTLRNLEIPVAQRDQMLLWTGGRLRTGEHWSVELAIGEDLIGKASPDFTAWLGMAWLPGEGGV